MLEDLSLELEAMGMSLQELKLEFMRKRFCDQNSLVYYKGSHVKEVQQLLCLGSIIRADLRESVAYNY